MIPLTQLSTLVMVFTVIISLPIRTTNPKCGLKLGQDGLLSLEGQFLTDELKTWLIPKFIQGGSSFINYYMYHGGTNFGRTAGGLFIATSYDYDAPIDEFDPSEVKR